MRDEAGLIGGFCPYGGKVFVKQQGFNMPVADVFNGLIISFSERFRIKIPFVLKNQLLWKIGHPQAQPVYIARHYKRRKKAETKQREDQYHTHRPRKHVRITSNQE